MNFYLPRWLFFLVMGSFLMSRRASTGLGACDARSVRWARLPWTFGTLAILVILASYGYELFSISLRSLPG